MNRVAIASVARRAWGRLDDALMPLRCVFCGTRTGCAGGQICGNCCDDLPWIEHACTLCAAPAELALPSGVHCASCQSRPPPFTITLAPLAYRFPVDAGLKALKFSRRLHYAAAFADVLAAQMQKLPGDVDALLPVPLHRRRQVLRGFNQAWELSLPLARRFGLPLTDIARRRRATSYQSGLSAAERRDNLRHAFAVTGKKKYRHIAIVDDVVTTGETTRQLATALIDSGVQRVSVIAVARAV
ncbi:MAG: ComF family protein [Gammaproteobacteria bacterium]|nr:ComF family protein [Gammaproteobacteria bacterium]